MIFHQPSVWLLLLLLLLPLAWWRMHGSRQREPLRFSSIDLLRIAGTTWAARLRWLTPALRMAALGLLIIGLARPQKPDEQTGLQTDAVAIQLVVDRSGSMRAPDFQLDGRAADRLAAVKRVVREFVIGGGSLPGRPDDLIGLIVFARHADSRCPITLDHGHLIEALEQTGFVVEREDDGTAIGEAIALGVERLAALDQRRDVRAGGRIRSRVMVVLTDGENNAGEIDPITAAEMAAAFGIRVHTIGAGSPDSFAPVPLVDRFGRRYTQRVPVGLDEASLQRIATMTGGQYFRATDTTSLQQIYARIDEMEKTRIEQKRYLEFAEMALEPVRLGRFTVPALIPVVFVLLSLELLLAHSRFRILP
jgi:Ca-activated chloride channel family protein